MHPTYHIVFHILPTLLFFFRMIIFHKIYLFTSNSSIAFRIHTTNWLRNHYSWTSINFYSWLLTPHWHNLISSPKFFIFWHCCHQEMHEIVSKAHHALTTCFTQLSFTEDEDIRQDFKILLLSFHAFFFSPLKKTPVCHLVVWTEFKKKKFKSKDIDYLERKIGFHLLLFCGGCYWMPMWYDIPHLTLLWSWFNIAQVVKFVSF